MGPPGSTGGEVDLGKRRSGAEPRAVAPPVHIGGEPERDRQHERQQPEHQYGPDDLLVSITGDVTPHGLSFVSGHAVMTAAMAGIIAPSPPPVW